MTKSSLISARTKFEAIGGSIAVVIDENYTFSDRAAFLIWDDSAETLTVIGPNKTQSASADDNRGQIYVFDYDAIVTIYTIPDLTKIDSWLGQFTTDTELASTIKNSFKKITNDKNFI